MDVMKAYKWWYNSFLQRMIGNTLRKKTATPCQIGKGPDLSRVDHHWRASTFGVSWRYQDYQFVIFMLVYGFGSSLVIYAYVI